MQNKKNLNTNKVNTENEARKKYEKDNQPKNDYNVNAKKGNGNRI